MSLAQTAHKLLFRKPLVTAIVIVGTAIVYEKAVDFATLQIFNTWNKGKQFRDIQASLEK
ncbi:cytochrome b-c1 complex subunit 9-like protein [Leptotrombidium deliense]|uniref:Complex III subunit 9 n=1 Tax=Leptotrombidium deliense TaxID=299467 RepID=A0A443SL34_9ACAR|nr:cytochrome b-c1 complex subunit 9-like protein [Leptotrombidium deliense]